MSVLVVGSVAIDTIRTPDGEEHRNVLGGSCTYFSYAASFLTDVQVVGVVGRDFDESYIHLLRKRRIDLDGLEIKPDGETFRWAGTYSADMNERTTDDLQFGVLGSFDPQLPEAYRDTPYVFLACAQPELQLKVIDQMRGKPLFVCDTIEFYIENHRDALTEVLRRVDGIIVNDGEARMLTGEANLGRAAQALLDMGPRFVVLKKGEHGGLLMTGEELYPLPAYPLLDVVDPTGAGDSFAGGFMGMLAKVGKSDTAALRQAAVYGTVLASFACEGISLNRFVHLTDEEVGERADAFLRMLAVPK